MSKSKVLMPDIDSLRKLTSDDFISELEAGRANIENAINDLPNYPDGKTKEILIAMLNYIDGKSLK